MKHFLYHYIALICYKMLLREHRIHWETTHISDPFHTGATQITEQSLEKYSHFTFIELDKKVYDQMYPLSLESCSSVSKVSEPCITFHGMVLILFTTLLWGSRMLLSPSCLYAHLSYTTVIMLSFYGPR